ncbi:AarF/ABC1/UbiB kinase family protein [Rhodococcus sp. ARC_M5]|uniref:ABC1 kinase family protein n=1 Tax=Rhodococcus sp. ARC_M5 TaxID=2928851 RepID=UPI001FB1AFFF|nr:AarF/ABC1/UbiB kinase family protein [Rhodococcus sp. ARC_M5]MCJ0894175.1 AarF/ABC1/UbiB kinase family protein [Rhodococcus sp. ARC_M5]
MTNRENPVVQGRLKRTLPLAGLTARTVGERFVAEVRERTGESGAMDRFHERTAARYTDLLGNSKGAMMKIGQLLSMIDLDGGGTTGRSPYQEALTRLQSDAPPMAPELVRDVLAAELPTAADLFVHFDEEPIAAASIGQVHRGVLHDGRDVAVKIQYPGVAQAIREDLANTELMATLVRFATSASSGGSTLFDHRSLVHEMAERIGEEVDYRREASTITAFADLYRGHPFIHVPDVVPEASTDRVLTMTYLDGMGWAAAQLADQELKNTWAEVVIRFSDGNFRHSNLLYADPHPGNYRFHPDGSIGFVDFGCVKVLSEDKRRLWVSIMRNVIDGDIISLRNDLVTAGFIAAGSPLTAEDIYEWYSQVLYEVVLAPQPATYNAKSGARTARWLFDLDSDNPLSRMVVPEDYVFAPRIYQAISTICGALEATLPARAIADDMDGVAEPVTRLGRLHHDWVRERGLPSATDIHESTLT